MDQQLFAPRAPARPAQAPADAAQAAQPLLGVIQTMRQVRVRIEQTDAGQETQALQRQIVVALDGLLRQARAQSQSATQHADESALPTARRPVTQPQLSPSTAGKASDKPATAGGTRSEPAAPGAKDRAAQLRAVREALKQLWGELPERTREQMLQQVPVEEFLPQYEALIEAYFRRLAEEPGRPR